MWGAILGRDALGELPRGETIAPCEPSRECIPPWVWFPKVIKGCPLGVVPMAPKGKPADKQTEFSPLGANTVWERLVGVEPPHGPPYNTLGGSFLVSFY